MSLAGNLNAAALTGALERYTKAVMGLTRTMITKADKEYLLGELRKAAAALGWTVPEYNGDGFRQWLEQERTAAIFRSKAAKAAA